MGYSRRFGALKQALQAPFDATPKKEVEVQHLFFTAQEA